MESHSLYAVEHKETDNKELYARIQIQRITKARNQRWLKMATTKYIHMDAPSGVGQA